MQHPKGQGNVCNRPKGRSNKQHFPLGNIYFLRFLQCRRRAKASRYPYDSTHDRMQKHALICGKAWQSVSRRPLEHLTVRVGYCSPPGTTRFTCYWRPQSAITQQWQCIEPRDQVTCATVPCLQPQCPRSASAGPKSTFLNIGTLLPLESQKVGYWREEPAVRALGPNLQVRLLCNPGFQAFSSLCKRLSASYHAGQCGAGGLG